MRVAVFSTKAYTRKSLDEVNQAHGHELVYFEPTLNASTAPLAAGSRAICAFVNDRLDRPVLAALRSVGVEVVALRCAGYNNVDLAAAAELGLYVCRVPAYSPYAVAEHAVGLMLALNRRIHRAHARVREGNFSLEGLLGFDMHGKTAGVVGTGKIGVVAARILAGFGCRLLAFDPREDETVKALGATYVDFPAILAQSDIITLHCPLMPATHHLIDWNAVKQMKDGVMLINTSRGALVDTRAAIAGLKLGKIGYLGLDVYEEEGDLFFEDLSNQVIQDDQFARLQTFPNVIITGHQAFFTDTALRNIGETTLGNLTAYERAGERPNAVLPAR